MQARCAVPAPLRAAGVMTNHLRVLIVDDSRVSRMMCAGILKILCPTAEVSQAENGLGAIELARTQNFELVVLDLNMPCMNGLEAAEQLRTILPEAKLALLTANAQASVMQRAATLGVRFFRKPITEAVIAQILSMDAAGDQAAR
jgi:CheY-like chemotaxis protein